MYYWGGGEGETRNKEQRCTIRGNDKEQRYTITGNDKEQRCTMGGGGGQGTEIYY